MTGARRRPSALTRALHTLPRAGGPGLAVAHRVERLRARGLRAALHRTKGRPADDTQALGRNDAAAYRCIWQAAADAAGAEVEELGGGFLLVRRDGVETMVCRNLAMVDHPVSIALALDKSLMAAVLGAHGVPVSEQAEAHRGDIASAAAHLAAGGGRWVVKPASDTGGGYGVTCGVETVDDLWRAWLWASVWNDRIVLERQVEGEEFRLLFLDGELLDAVHRSLPTVTGDGRATVAELIAAENHRRLVADDEVGRAIKIDLDCELALRRGGLTLRSVVPAGEQVAVKGNVGDNCAAENATARHLPPALVARAASAARLARLRFAGVDVVTPDPRRSLEEAGGVVLEVNGTPGLQHHYLVRDRSAATPVATVLLETLLREAADRSTGPPGA